YKYLQWGEGNCFLRFPEECTLRPAITGWFASFSTLEEPRDGRQQRVEYGERDQRFASGTYDAASQYRAARVTEFFREQGLTPQRLRDQYQGQVGLLREMFLEQEFDPDSIRLHHTRPLEHNGGFLSLRSPMARELQSRLMERGVFTDARGKTLRIGPAPYTTTGQIGQCIEALGRAVRDLF
ncbi:MAG: hypothetical protein R3224_05235, partial [Balneolaceae bacterium]|nr:hypothetical protein [Balneolaceae bacterium]